MKIKSSIFFLLILNGNAWAQFPISLINNGGSFDKEIAQGWMDVSIEKDKYEMKGTNEQNAGDTTVGYVKSKESTADGAGALLRAIAVDNYRGKRVRMSAFVKTTNVHDSIKGGAGLWFLGVWDGAGVVDQIHVKGTTGWKKYSIVVDISPYVFEITYGAFLHGAGQMWFKKIHFEIVDKTVPVTASEQSH
jgi:hypothetical protein